jgi:galactonate dehydratase
VAAVRAAIGPGRRLLVDCHWRLTEAAARNLLRELEPFALHWFECPLREDPAMLPALRRLRSQANVMGVRLAGCESMTGLAAFESFLDAGAYDVIMPDVKYAGGLAEMLRIGEAAEARGVACSLHNPSGPIAHLHSVHVSAVLAALPFLEFQYGESPHFFDIVEGSMPDPNGGASAVPSGRGLGVRIDPAKLARLAA